jgi:hypothetical protein
MGICGSLFLQARTSVAVLDACGLLHVSAVILWQNESNVASIYGKQLPRRERQGKMASNSMGW